MVLAAWNRDFRDFPGALAPGGNERANERKQKNGIAPRQSKTDDGILACISNAYIKKVLILSGRSFVSPRPFPGREYESETSPWGI